MEAAPLTRPLRVLITNNTLGARSGSELFVRDLAIGLLRRGHLPVAYSPVLGEVAAELRRATVPVIDDLDQLGEPPDIIHGQHHHETMTAALHFADRPAVFVCHGWLPWEENPPLFPTIQRFVAVDDLCRERLLTTRGIQQPQVSTIYNFADVERFTQRPPLPQRPHAALIFSNYASGIGDAIRAGCEIAGIERIGIIGIDSGHATMEPETVLPQYDIVFAKGRAAIEALVAGCAVVVADYGRIATMVDTHNLGELRRYNFGIRTLQTPLTLENVRNALARYDPVEARRVSDTMRAAASASAAIDCYLALYREVIDAWQSNSGNPSPEEAVAFAARYLRWLSPVVKERHSAAQRVSVLEAERDAARARVEQLENERARHEDDQPIPGIE